jgi:flagellar biogenesis protein FliO
MLYADTTINATTVLVVLAIIALILIIAYLVKRIF